MDLDDIEKRYEGAGHPAYHPKIVLIKKERIKCEGERGVYVPGRTAPARFQDKK
jgi:hypothetical protein